jgi:hypothetical protein
MAKKRKTEPPILRKFTASNKKAKVTDVGKIDTGANATFLSRTLACRLEPNMSAPDTLGETNAGLVGGNLIEVVLRVGKRELPVKAYVPAVVYLPDGSTQSVREGKNLIGLDFLRGTKAVIDFKRRRGDELLQGIPDPREITSFRPMTKRERAQVAHIRCRVPVRKKRR